MTVPFLVRLALISLLFSEICRADSTDAKTTLSGQISITAPSGKKVPLTQIEVNLYPLAVINAAVATAAKQGPLQEKSFQAQIAAQQQKCADDTTIYNGMVRTNESRGIPVFNNPDVKKVSEQIRQDFKYLSDLVYASVYYKTCYFYMRELPVPYEHKEVDASGKFNLQVQNKGDWVLLASAEFASYPNAEPYFWCLKLNSGTLKKGRIALTNENLATTSDKNNIVPKIDQATIHAEMNAVPK